MAAGQLLGKDVVVSVEVEFAGTASQC